MKKLNKLFYSIILVFYVILVDTTDDENINSTTNNNVDWIVSSVSLDEIYMQNVFNFKILETCDELPIYKKTAICDYVLGRIAISKYFRLIYFNRNAYVHLSVDCEEHIISFENEKEYNNFNIKKKLFPCYGRHDPMRSSWYADDALNYFYIGEGTSSSEYYVFRFDKHFIPDNDSYVLTDGVYNLNADLLSPPTFTTDLLNKEIKSLEFVSRNIAVEEIELEYSGALEKTFIKNSICDLPVNEKILVCELIISHSDPSIFVTILDRETFTDESAKCISKYLNFQYAPYDNYKFSMKMFPCKSKVNFDAEKPWYIADGYRNFSVLVLRDVDSRSNLVQFYEFYENLSSQYSTTLAYESKMDIGGISLNASTIEGYLLNGIPAVMIIDQSKTIAVVRRNVNTISKEKEEREEESIEDTGNKSKKLFTRSSNISSIGSTSFNN